MFTFTDEFFNGALIGFILGLLVNWKEKQLHVHNTKFLPAKNNSAEKIYYYYAIPMLD